MESIESYSINFSTLSLTESGIRSADHKSTASLSGSDIIPSNSEVCLLSIWWGEVSPAEDKIVLCDSGWIKK